MGAGKVAPAALMVSAEAAIVAAAVKNAMQRICLFMNPPSFSLAGTAFGPSPVAIDALEARHAARQRITDVEVDGAVVGSFGAGADVPRVTRQVLILTDHIDRAVARIGPNGLIETEGDFLNGLVLAVRRT